MYAFDRIYNESNSTLRDVDAIEASCVRFRTQQSKLTRCSSRTVCLKRKRLIVSKKYSSAERTKMSVALRDKSSLRNTVTCISYAERKDRKKGGLLSGGRKKKKHNWARVTNNIFTAVQRQKARKNTATSHIMITRAASKIRHKILRW